MVAELNHRVKNILAIVQSVAAQTVRSSGSLDAFADAFAGRLKALAIAHDILTETRWSGIGLRELLAAVLAPYRSADESRVSIFGPAILVPARLVVPLSMVLHELTTNAAKYGALSTRRGTIDISWQLRDSVDQAVALIWQERGGPPVKAPTSPGFGMRLIERVVSHDLDGKTEINYDPAGMRCTMAFSVREAAGKRATGSNTATA
jgi:two-component sensor histidine kinase